MSEKEPIKITSVFSCAHCMSGSNYYSELFDHGTCKNCGAGLSEFYSTVTEIGRRKIERSVMLIYADDISEIVENMKSELQSNGIGTIDIHDIISGSHPQELGANIAHLMENTMYSFVVPSRKIETDKQIKTVLNAALMDKMEGKDKSPILVPILVNSESVNYTPYFIKDIVGAKWNESVKGDHYAISKDQFISQIRAEISKKI